MQERTLPLRDYTLENDLLVMSEEYLLSRGFCCHNQCRHCPYDQTRSGPKVISFVPSMTETLLAAGVQVVGRTRYCLHAKDLVSSIPIVGGTKDLQGSILEKLNADYVLLDREENTKEMSNSIKSHILCTHVESLESLSKDLQALALSLKNTKLNHYAARIDQLPSGQLKEIPVQKWWRQNSQSQKVAYLIWKDPWMVITAETFIGSVIAQLGFELWAPKGRGKYPQIDLTEIPSDVCLLFSSEPYPFEKFESKFLAMELPHNAALVDGEKYSWFGLRSIRFLEDCLNA